MTYTGALDIAQWTVSGKTIGVVLTRLDGQNWATGVASDFAVGQQVVISDVPGTWRVVRGLGNDADARRR